MLTKDQILKAGDVIVESVDVPEWGGIVFVRSMSGSDLDEYEGENYRVMDGKVAINKRNIRARLLVRCICDEKGEPIFTLKDVDALGKKSSRALNKVVEAAQRLNGISDKSLEAAAKNSESGLGEDSTSD